MDKVKIDDAKPGMITARPVSDASGNVLINENTELSEDTINRLKSRGITDIPVKPKALTPEEKTAERESVEKKISHMFEHVRDDEVMAAIEQATRSVLLSKYV